VLEKWSVAAKASSPPASEQEMEAEAADAAFE